MMRQNEEQEEQMLQHLWPLFDTEAVLYITYHNSTFLMSVLHIICETMTIISATIMPGFCMRNGCLH